MRIAHMLQQLTRLLFADIVLANLWIKRTNFFLFVNVKGLPNMYIANV